LGKPQKTGKDRDKADVKKRLLPNGYQNKILAWPMTQSVQGQARILLQPARNVRAGNV
jgi:hypothetical protein